MGPFVYLEDRQMTFEKWWNKYLFLGDELDKELAKAAWEAGFEEGVEWLRKHEAMHQAIREKRQRESEDCFSICGGQHEYCTCINKPKP